jgi:hypothetical protein
LQELPSFSDLKISKVCVRFFWERKWLIRALLAYRIFKVQKVLKRENLKKNCANKTNIFHFGKKNIFVFGGF